MISESGITLKAIGVVRNGIKERPSQGWGEIISDIVIHSSLTEALDNLDEFSHIIIIWWMHQVVAHLGQVRTKIHPTKRGELPVGDLPVVGLFATRSPNRPNPVGKTTVRLLQREGNILRVKGLDAVDGTPVIDIKPYIPGYDSATDAKAPLWITNRRAKYY